MRQHPLRSLRLQILLGMVVSILLMFVFCTLSLHFVLRHHIYDQFFDELHDRARTLAKYVEFEEGELSFEWAHYDVSSTMAVDTEDGTGCLFKVWNAPGSEMASINIFEGFDIAPGYPADASPEDPPHFKPLTLPDGSPAYQVSFRFDPVREDDHPIKGPMPTMGITVVRRTVSVDQTMWRTDVTLVGATSITMLLSLAGMWLLIHWGLKPLEPVLKQLKAIGAGDLSQRVDPGKLPSELVSIIQTVNDLLAALEIKVARERRFVANAAHELRNPITAVQANLEVGLLNNDNPQLREEVGQTCLEAARHLQFVCERLLSLAGLQQDNIALELQSVEVVELMDSIASDLQEAADAKGISFAWERNDQACVQTDPVLANVIFSNLLRNAVSYGLPGQVVKLGNEVFGDQVRVTVKNVMSEPRELDLEKVMEPFWRGEESRSLGQGNLGLGLAIVQTALDQLHGQIKCTVQTQEDDAGAQNSSHENQVFFVASVTLPMEWKVSKVASGA